ncbi:MAG: hypothetical protein HQK63_02040 [Desulfamplus sp.]|nr:hypothetical protein [Desulfamplus sp.]
MTGISTAGKYSAATFEYAGRLSLSYVKRSGYAAKRGGCAVIAGVKKITTPVINTVAKPFVYFKDKRAKSFQEKELKAIDRHAWEHDKLVQETTFKDSIVSETTLHNEKIRALEEKISHIEQQLEALEKNGLRVFSAGNTVEKQNIVKQQKRLTEQKSAFLQALVNENKALRDS